MKKLLTLSMFFAFALVTAVNVNATTITFDGFSNNYSGGGEVTGNEWAASGVVFSTNGLLNLGTTTGSSPNSLGADINSNNDFSGDLTIQFSANKFVDDLSFVIFNTPFQASAYDVNNVLVKTIVNGAAFEQIFDFSGFNVNRVDISGTFYAIDDVTFGALQPSDPVPEPATLFLLGTGLLGVAGYRKKEEN